MDSLLLIDERFASCDHATKAVCWVEIFLGCLCFLLPQQGDGPALVQQTSVRKSKNLDLNLCIKVTNSLLLGKGT